MNRTIVLLELVVVLTLVGYAVAVLLWEIPVLPG